MNRVEAGLLVVVVLLAAAPVATVPTDGATAGAGGPAATAVEADHLEFRITVHDNASARWTFTYTRMLENDTERDRFRAFAEEFETNETDAYREFRDQARGLAASGRNATGREMEATAFSRSARMGGNCVTAQDCGTIQMSFVWTGFAAQDGDRLVAGDVFGTGLFLSSNQQLVFEAAPGLAFGTADPGSYTPEGEALADSSSITYEGEQSFSDGRPRVVFLPESAAGAPATTDPGTSPTDGPTETGDDDTAGGVPLALVGGLLVIVAGVAAAFVWWRGEGGAIPVDGDAGDGGAAAERADDADGEPAVPDEELLTDEDRVVRLLEDNGGRMKQVDIVDETGWSKSKVSMLLSDMEDEDQISKLRVGRENIISLAGHEPEAAGSPHEED